MLAVTSPLFVLFALLLTQLWYACAPARRWLVMLAASAVFYLSQDVRGYFVLLAATLVVWLCALCAHGRRICFYIGLAAALLPLTLLKYLPAARWQSGWQALGIGYFTLQLIGYLVDVRRGTIQAEANYARLLCFASCFLCITQGPITRYAELSAQWQRPTAWDSARVWRGLQRSAWGYFKKLAVADRAKVVVDAVYANPAAFDRSQLLFGGALYTVQLLADFSAYTDIVLGLGEAMGLTLPENFRQPFLADSVKDLWARWHISLSHWLRDYIYFPLGGSRCSTVRRDINLLVTFLVSGLWHGASATYLLWGALHGVSQVIQDHLPKHKPLPKALRALGASAWLIFAFMIFRASSLQNAAELFAGILDNGGHKVFANYWEIGLVSRLELVLLLAGVAVFLAVEALHERGISLRDRIAALSFPKRLAVYEICFFVFLFMGKFLGTGGFLYAKY